MGLDTTHDCWSGGYRSFNNWRAWLCKQFMIDINTLQGFGGTKSFKQLPPKLIPLINHSDCDGELSVEECKQVVQVLELILDTQRLLPDDNEEWYVEKTKQFVLGLKNAISKNEPVIFC